MNKQRILMVLAIAGWAVASVACGLLVAQNTQNSIHSDHQCPQNKDIVYIIQRGDNLTRIARANNLALNQLLIDNPQYQANPDLIYPGQSVFLGGAYIAQQWVNSEKTFQISNIVAEVKNNADCSLISAAPDLLDACKEALGYIIEVRMFEDEYADQCEKVLNEAIAKAKGKED